MVPLEVYPGLQRGVGRRTRSQKNQAIRAEVQQPGRETRSRAAANRRAGREVRAAGGVPADGQGQDSADAPRPAVNRAHTPPGRSRESSPESQSRLRQRRIEHWRRDTADAHAALGSEPLLHELGAH